MSQTIKLKRGTTTPTTSDLVSGEVAIDTSAKKFYINDSGTIKEIGGVGTLSVSDIPNLPASKITSGTFAAARIPGLAASKITSGTFDAARIPSLAASKITSGTFDPSRIPTLDQYVKTAGDTMTGNLVVEDSEIHVGDTSGDNWTRIKHAQADGYGFDWQHNNATVLVNEQGSTNEALVLGDVDAGNYSGLFGISHTTNAGTNWTKKLDLRGNGELYIGASGTSRTFHDGYHPNADKWTTPRSHTVTLTGDVTGTATQNVDGSGNKTWSIATSLSDTYLTSYTETDTLDSVTDRGATTTNDIQVGHLGVDGASNSSYPLYVHGHIAQGSGSIYSFGDFVMGNGGLKKGSTTIIDSSRNLSNIGNATFGGNLTFSGDSRKIIMTGGTTNSQPSIAIGEQDFYGYRQRWDSAQSVQLEGWWSTSTTGATNRDFGSLNVNTKELTHKGKFQVLQAGTGTSNAESAVAAFSGQSSSGNTLDALSLVNSITAANSNGVALAFHTASNYSPTGKIITRQEASGSVTDSRMIFQIYRGTLKDAMILDHDENLTVGGNLKLTGGGIVEAPSSSGGENLTLRAAGEVVVDIDSNGNSGDNEFFKVKKHTNTDLFRVKETGDADLPLGGLGVGTSDWDTTNLALDVNGNVSIRRLSRLYLGVNSNNYNSWQAALTNSGSTAEIWSQALNHKNTGYGSLHFFQSDSNGFDIKTGALRIGGTNTIDANRKVMPTMYTGSHMAVSGTSTTANHVITGAVLGHGAEDNHVTHPFLHNDLANFVARGGTVTFGGLNTTPDLTQAFKPNSKFTSLSSSNYTGSTFTITLTNLPKGLNYGGYTGISFGSISWAPASMKIEVSTDGGTTWTTRLNAATKRTVYFTNNNAGASGVNAIRFTIGQPTSSLRIMNIWAYNYDSHGMDNYFLDKAGGVLYGELQFNDANTKLLEGGANALKVQTNSGYLEIGPRNTSHCHFITDRSNYYFDKELRVNSGIIGSYDEDLVLRRATNSADQITLTTSGVVFASGYNLNMSGSVTATSIVATQSGMSTFGTNLTNNDDWQNSAISIRERGNVSSAQTADKYAPNINFHWGGRFSKSVWVNDNTFHFGEYDSSGIPQTSATNMSLLSAQGYQVGSTTVIDSSRNLTNIGTIAASGISTFQRDIKSAGMVRAAGWYNEAADTNYDDLAIEIGASGSTGYIISYDRDATQYYNMEIGALRHKFAVKGNNPNLLLERYSGQPTIKADSDDGGYLIMDSQGGRAALNWYTSDAVVLAQGGGNVGIGTGASTPSNQLHVHSASSSDIAKFQNSNGSFILGHTSGLTSIDLPTSGDLRIRAGSTQLIRFTSAGQLKGPDGTGTAPAYTFNSDPNTGMFSGGADVLKFTTGGTNGLTINATDIVMLRDNVSVKDKLRHYGDTDTYIRFTTDRIRLVAGNVTYLDAVEGATDYLRMPTRAVTIGDNVNPQACLTIQQNSTATPANGGGTDSSTFIRLDNSNTTASASSIIIFNADDAGGNTRHGAGIQFKKASNWGNGSGSYPGELYFWTRPSSGNQAAAQKLDKDGNAIFKGNVTAYGSLSDRRLKENIEPIADAVAKVEQLEGVTFNYKKDGKRSTGLIAQDLEKVLEEAVYTTEDIETGEEHKAIHYGNTVGLLVNAIKEQQQTINQLTKRIEDLENGNH